MSLFSKALWFIAFGIGLGACAAAPSSGDRSGPRPGPSQGVGAAPESPSPEAALLQPTLDFYEWVRRSDDEAGAVLTVLGALTAEVAWADAFGSADVHRHALAPVIQRARELLASGAFTAEQRAVAERRLRKIELPQDVLDQISRPVAQPLFEKISAHSDAELCRDVWADGFPAGTPLAGLDCFVYDSYPAGTDRMRIYIPTTWRGDAARLRVVRAAAQAVVRSERFYSRLGRLPRLRVVFTPSYYLESDGSVDTSTYAHVPGALPAGHCPITIWQATFEVPLGVVRQTLAHEVFHCLQAAAIGRVSSGGFDAARWWVEGGAEYFGNVVYPRVNDERQWDDAFAAQIGIKPLTTLDYTAYPFFQHLEADLGSPEQVFQFMRGLARSGGQAAQRRALGSRYGVDGAFHAFAKGVLEGTIRDTDGSPISFARPRVQRLDPSTPADVDGPPFSIKLASVRVPEGQVLRMGMEANPSSLDAMVSSRTVPGETGVWESPPHDELDTSCGEKAEVFVLTSTEGAATGGLSYRYDPFQEEKDCEPEPAPPPPPSTASCAPLPGWLHGRWKPSLGTAFSPASIDRLFPSAAGELRFAGHSGSVVMEVTPALVRYTYRNLELRFVSDGGGPNGGAMHTTMVLNGSSASQGCYEAGTFDMRPSRSSVQMGLTIEFPGTDMEPVEGPMDLSSVFSTAPQGQATITRQGQAIRMVIRGPTGDGSLRVMFQDVLYTRL